MLALSYRSGDLGMRALPVSASLLLWAAALPAQSVSTTRSADLTWGPAPAVFPAGAQMAVVSGDPGKAEKFTVQLSMPDGYAIPPHFHPTDETVTVRKGALLVGMGDSLDLKKAKTMKPGAKGTLAAGEHHFAAAKGATVVSITSMGPFAMTYVNPADNPEKAATP
jgi:quercetin dioxygenase-like cupin family protein